MLLRFERCFPGGRRGTTDKSVIEVLEWEGGEGGRGHTCLANHLESTSHPKIMKANDPSKKFDEIFSALDGLKKMVMEHNEEELKKRIVSFSNR